MIISVNNMRVFITGFMGVGKSYWASRWAAKINYNLLDTDIEIEKISGLNISAIFHLKGEKFFRELESKVLHLSTNSQNCIIATGGGCATYSDNFNFMKKNGIVVYLKASQNFLFNRLVVESDKRPLISNKSHSELKDYITKTLSEREMIYNNADVVLDAEKVSDTSILEILNYA